MVNLLPLKVDICHEDKISVSMVKSWDKQGAIARLEASYLHAEEQEEAAWELETVSMSMRFLRIIIEALGQMMPGGRY